MSRLNPPRFDTRGNRFDAVAFARKDQTAREKSNSCVGTGCSQITWRISNRDGEGNGDPRAPHGRRDRILPSSMKNWVSSSARRMQPG